VPDWLILPLPYAVLLLLGGFLLFWASGRFVDHAAHLARTLSVPPVVVGALVLGFGTSLPELLVSLGAAADGSPSAAVGNVVGSNIANVGLILGTAALIGPLRASRSLLRNDLPLGALTAIALTVWGLNSSAINWHVGLALLAGFVGYLWLMLGSTKRHRKDMPLFDNLVLPSSGDDLATVDADEVELTRQPEASSPARSVRKDLLWAAVGGLGVAYGAATFVKGAKGTAEALGVPEEVIALSIMALGTSLPELATTLAACMRGETDMAIGNVAGSNLFNLLLVLGVCSLGWDLPVSDAMSRVDFPVLCGFTLLAFPLFSRKGELGRLHGALLVFLYLSYTVWIYTHGRT